MSRNKPEISSAEKELDKLKWEVAEELHLDDDIEERGFANMTTHEVGQIGGNMVKKMVEYAENKMSAGEDITD